MTDAPPPSIPPSIPPRKRPSSEARAPAVTTVPGRGEIHTNGTAHAPVQRADEARPARGSRTEEEERPAPVTSRVDRSRRSRAPQPEDARPVPSPFPVVGLPVLVPDRTGDATVLAEVAVDLSGAATVEVYGVWTRDGHLIFRCDGECLFPSAH